MISSTDFVSIIELFGQGIAVGMFSSAIIYLTASLVKWGYDWFNAAS